MRLRRQSNFTCLEKLKLAEFWKVLLQGHRNSKQLQEVEILSSRETEN